MITRICLLSLCLALAGCGDPIATLRGSQWDFDLGTHVNVIGMGCRDNLALHDYFNEHFDPMSEADVAARYAKADGCRSFVGKGVVVERSYPDAYCVRPHGEAECLYVFADSVTKDLGDPPGCGGPPHPECSPPRKRTDPSDDYPGCKRHPHVVGNVGISGDPGCEP